LLKEDPRVFKDINDSNYNKLLDDVVKFFTSIKERVINAGKILELKEGFDKQNICGQIKRDMKERHAKDSQVHYVNEICSEYDTNWLDHRYDKIRDSNDQEADHGLQILTRKISDKEFKELLDSHDDTLMYTLAEFDLTFEQISKFSLAEKQQYRDIRARLFSEYKAHIDHGKNNFEDKMRMLGLLSDEDRNKKSTLQPPKELWGYSDTYKYLQKLAAQHDTISKYLADVARQVFIFRLEKKLDKEALGYCKSYHDKRLIPLMQVALIAGTEVTNILENVQDEKNRDTTLGWMIKGMHKHWDYGNHGTGEVDFIQTGEYIFRLGKENNVVIKVPIRRETTREQVGDKTTVKILDKTNQLQIECPNHFDIKCAKCNNTEFTIQREVRKDPKDPDSPRILKDVKWDKSCGLKFNKPIVGDEERDIFAGDLFYKAVEILQANELSKAIETICDNVIIQEIQTPEEFYKKEMKKQGKTINVTDKNQIKVVEAKPEKIKEVKIDPNSKSTIAYNIFYGRAHRTQQKSEHFSENA